ncbi:MAG: DUF2332 domain-containing protein [Actinomycetota bacterium]
MTAALRDWWRSFAEYSLAEYSPRYHDMVMAAADDADVMALVAAAPPEAHVPNNLHAAARYLLLTGADHELAAAYESGYVGDPGPAFCDLVLANRDEIAGLLATRYVQTNEVNRTAVIAPCVNRIAAEAGSPVSLIDLGCSAGLNLIFDRYRLDVGDVSLGPADAELRLWAESRGAPAHAEAASIPWRRGVDRNPIDVTDPDEALWLRALIWPDQPERAERLAAAIAAFVEDPPELVRAPALEGLAGALADAPEDTLALVVTTWVVFYFDEELRRDFERMLIEADRPTAWLAMEMGGIVDGVELPEPPDGDGEVSAMTVVSGGAGRPVQRRFLGWTHPHGAWVDLAP